MLKPDDLCLCSGIASEAGYEELLSAASKAGFTGLSLWPTHHQSALASGLDIKGMRALLDDHGLQLSEFDAMLSLLPGPAYEAPDIPLFKYDEDYFLDVASALGARSINVMQFHGPQLPTNQAGDLLGGFCEKAAAHSLLVSLEFVADTPIPDLPSAMAVLEAAGAENSGLNLDTWHFHRSGALPEDLRALPKGSVIALQLNDALAEPWDDAKKEMAKARELPGDGVINLHSIMQELRALECDAPLAIEVFNVRFKTASLEDTLTQLADSLRVFATGL